MYAASYIGGGVNYTAVGEAVNASDTLFATGAAADTIMTNVWMVATALIPALLVRYYASIYDQGRVAEGIRAEEERSEEHTSELQSRQYLVCRLLLEKKKKDSRYILILDPRATTASQRHPYNDTLMHHVYYNYLLLTHDILVSSLRCIPTPSPSSNLH